MALGLEAAVAQYLADNGFGTFLGADATIFVGQEPEAPDDTITIYPAGGQAYTDVLGENHRLQVRVRNTSYEACHETIRDVFIALHDLQGNLQGIPVARVTSLAPPSPIGQDTDEQGGRWRFTQLFDVITRRFDFY